MYITPRIIVLDNVDCSDVCVTWNVHCVLWLFMLDGIPEEEHSL